MSVVSGLAGFATATVCLLGSAPGRAEVRLAAEGAIKVLCADASETRHPNRTELFHMVSPDAEATAALLILQYESDESGNAGRVNADVKLWSSDGTRARLGKLSAPTDAQTAVGQATELVSANLENAAAASWDIRFKELGRLPARDCVLVLAAVSAQVEE